MRVKIIVLILVFLLSLFGFSQATETLHVPGCSWESTDLTLELDVRVHQWIDITWEATPYHLCDATFIVYEETGFVFFYLFYDSNATVIVTVDFPDPHFRDDLGSILDNISIEFFIKEISGENEDSYLQATYNWGTLLTIPGVPLTLPDAMTAEIIISLDTLTSNNDTPAGIYHLPVVFTFNPTVSW
ncbi:MAG: hypothetical protein H0Z24_02320 [Thermosipho sp. (in: Bacteria)]|nr:hypothetical protein [Thermosipho sp. (in: thermotogales)]